MNTDAELEAALLGGILVRLRKRVLHVYGTLDGIHHARELSQHTVTSRIRNAPAMLGN
jgi:hypothetical protein